MQQLSTEEWRLLDKIILKIQELHSTIEFEHFILEELPAYIGAEFSSWNEHNSKFYLEKVANSADYEEQVTKMLPILNKVLPTHPSFKHYYDFETGKVRLKDTVERTRELDVNGSYHSTDFYKEMASKLNIEDQLLMHIYVNNGKGVILTFHGTQEFTENQHLMASILRGHMLTRLYHLTNSNMKEGKSSHDLVDELESIVTHREFEVFRWLCAGFSNSEIAEKLNVSQKTIHNHVAKILGKLKLKSRHRVIAKYAPWINVLHQSAS